HGGSIRPSSWYDDDGADLVRRSIALIGRGGEDTGGDFFLCLGRLGLFDDADALPPRAREVERDSHPGLGRRATRLGARDDGDDTGEHGEANEGPQRSLAALVVMRRRRRQGPVRRAYLSAVARSSQTSTSICTVKRLVNADRTDLPNRALARSR